jgi:hypothetical protein
MRFPVILVVAGVLLFLVSLTADITTIGEGTGVGWKQIAGAATGVVIAAIGIVRLRRND